VSIRCPRPTSSTRCSSSTSGTTLDQPEPSLVAAAFGPNSLLTKPSSTRTSC
jgi:hypothetical protein